MNTSAWNVFRNTCWESGSSLLLKRAIHFKLILFVTSCVITSLVCTSYKVKYHFLPILYLYSIVIYITLYTYLVSILNWSAFLRDLPSKILINKVSLTQAKLATLNKTFKTSISTVITRCELGHFPVESWANQIQFFIASVYLNFKRKTT